MTQEELLANLIANTIAATIAILVFKLIRITSIPLWVDAIIIIGSAIGITTLQYFKLL